MSYPSNIEDILNGLKTFITNNLNTYLAGITAAKGDSISLPMPQEIDVDDADPFNKGRSPVLLIFPNKVSNKSLSMGTDLLVVEVGFILAITGGKKENLVTQIERYTEAMRQMFCDDPKCDEIVDGMLEDINMVYYPSMPGDQQKKIAVISAGFYKQVTR